MTKLTLVTPEDVPDVPFTVTEVVPGVELAAVLMVKVVVPLPLGTLVGMKEQLAPAGNPEQVKVTVPVKPLFGVSVMVVVVVVPAATVAGLNAVAERVNGESTCAIANASTEPNPVTWSYPGPALNPICVVPEGQLVLGAVQGTLLSPVVTS